VSCQKRVFKEKGDEWARGRVDDYRDFRPCGEFLPHLDVGNASIRPMIKILMKCGFAANHGRG